MDHAGRSPGPVPPPDPAERADTDRRICRIAIDPGPGRVQICRENGAEPARRESGPGRRAAAPHQSTKSAVWLMRVKVSRPVSGPRLAASSRTRATA